MGTYESYQDYKNSQNSWVGNIPNHWNIQRADFLTQTNRLQVSADSLDGVELIHYSIPNVQEFGTGKIENGDQIESAKLLISEQQLLVSKLNPRKSTLCIAVPNDQYTVVASSEFVPLLAGKTHLGYSYYVWGSDKITKLLSSLVQSVTRSHQRVNPSDILKIYWAWPPIHEQKAIARFLDHKTAQIDSLITKKQSLLDKLAEQRTALISQAVTKGLDPSAPLKDSGVDWLGEIPALWQRVLLVRLIRRFEQGWSPSCEAREASQDEWGVLKSGCVNYGIFNERQHKTLPISLKPIESLEVKPGNILMCRASGSKHLIGSVARVISCRPNLIFSDKTYLISVNENLIDPDFFVFAMKSKYIREQIELSISGADGLANNIPQASVKSYQFVLPEIDEQKAIVKVLTEKSDRISLQEEKAKAVIERLQEYRSALITNAVTGKIDVRDFCASTTTEQREVANG